MGEVKSSRKKPAAEKLPGPSSLTLHLHAPGMTLLHRAGLGGLAATLKAMERRHKLGCLTDHELPVGPNLANGYPWEVNRTSVILCWGEPMAASEYLRKLFAFGFGIKDKMIDLPGTYRDELSRAVRAELQLGLTFGFLQHGNTRKLNKPSTQFHDPTGDGLAAIAVEWRPCLEYKHQHGAEELASSRSGRLNTKRFKIEGPLAPGAVVRHNAFSSDTKLQEPVELALALYFSIVGSLSLAANRSTGVILVPDVTDVRGFSVIRPRMTPTSARDCRIASPGDAALQLAVRLRAERVMGRHGFTAVYAMRCQPTPWATQQKSRTTTLFLPANRTFAAIGRFQIALSHLPARVRSKEVKVGRGKNAIVQTKWFWIESIVRPLVADNLAGGRRWYDRFDRLMLIRDGTKKVSYDRKGLQSMAEERELLDDDEMNFLRALHRAIFMARGKIYADTMGQGAAKQKPPATQAVKNRWKRLMERLRLELLGGKTQDQTQAAITELLGRTGSVKELRDDEALRQVKNLIFGRDWQRARNLALFAVASYKRPTDKEPLPGDPEDAPDEDHLEAELEPTE